VLSIERQSSCLSAPGSRALEARSAAVALSPVVCAPSGGKLVAQDNAPKAFSFTVVPVVLRRDRARSARRVGL
jgi:hypothetical protein